MVLGPRRQYIPIVPIRGRRANVDESAVAASAWNIDPVTKTVELLEGGHHVFTTTTRTQLSSTVARVLKKQPSSARNQCIFVASFEVNMLTWLDAYKQIKGSEGWTITNITTDELTKRSQQQLAEGDFPHGYMGLAKVVCTGPGYLNHFSEFATLINEELRLPREDLIEVVRAGLALPDPFGHRHGA